jgi:fatty acid desaturase
MINPLDLLTREQLADVKQRSDLKGIWVVAFSWMMIFGAMAMFAIWPNPLTFIAAVLIIGTRQLGLAIGMHDGAHGVLTKSPSLNMFLSQWLCSYPMLAETNAYRRYHLVHHRNTQQENDPDLILSKPFPITRKSFRRKMIRDLTGQTGYQQRKAQMLNALGDPSLPWDKRIDRFASKLGPAVFTNLVLFSILAVAGQWHLYFLLWVLPMLTWHQAVTRIRNIAEHAMVPDNDDPFRNARTVEASWWERLLLAPGFVNYHVEHHLFMWVPCYNLPKLHKYLLANGHGDKMEIKGSYWEVIRMATSRPDDEDKPGEVVHNARKRRVAGVVSEGFEEAEPNAA